MLTRDAFVPACVRTDYRCSSPVHLISFDSMGFWRSNKKHDASKQQSLAQPAQQPVPQVPAPDASSRGQQDVVSSAQSNSRELDQITEAIRAAAEQTPTAAATAVAPLVRPAAAPGKAAAGLDEPKRAAGDERLGPKRQAASSPALAALKRRTSAHQPQAPAAPLTAYAGPQHSAAPSPAPAPAADSRAVAAGASEAAPAASVSAPPAPGRVVAARQVRATSDSLCFDDGALLTAATQHGRARPAEAQTGGSAAAGSRYSTASHVVCFRGIEPRARGGGLVAACGRGAAAGSSCGRAPAPGVPAGKAASRAEHSATSKTGAGHNGGRDCCCHW